ncbi:hypothetical protein BD324DRAFT_609570 [Kockovaella imperatae]|uniref:RanBP2-type domain-containing protein n=1 Tax=Kockovaella imperatae TaxID=4999 RepID=A0A1Y1UBA6_9TREE|nr:hypothetical protein BD324DRAFT_609570 [Kockovaella imperatae]ORX35328.1 hypothetical protein BD324DRAFT_609570 [Kockovaella imperatae]
MPSDPPHYHSETSCLPGVYPLTPVLIPFIATSHVRRRYPRFGCRVLGMKWQYLRQEIISFLFLILSSTNPHLSSLYIPSRTVTITVADRSSAIPSSSPTGHHRVLASRQGLPHPLLPFFGGIFLGRRGTSVSLLSETNLRRTVFPPFFSRYSFLFSNSSAAALRCIILLWQERTAVARSLPVLPCLVFRSSSSPACPRSDLLDSISSCLLFSDLLLIPSSLFSRVPTWKVERYRVEAQLTPRSVIPSILPQMPSLVFCPVFTASPESIFPNAESTIQVPPYPQPQASDNPASMRSNVQANRWAIAVDTEDHLAHRKGCWRVVDQCDRERRLGPISGGVGRAHANPKDEIEETVSSRRVPSTIDMDRIARIWGKGDCDKVKTQKSPVIGHNGQLFQLSDFAKESKNDQITRIHTRQGLFVLVERGVDNCPFKSAKSCREANRHSFVVGGSSPIQESSTSNETSGATTPERDGQGEFAAAQAMAKQVPTQKDEPSAGQSLEPWNRDQKVPRYRQIPLRAPHGTPAGQWPGDWACPTCWYINFGRNRRCIKCFPRPRIYQDARTLYRAARSGSLR